MPRKFISAMLILCLSLAACGANTVPSATPAPLVTDAPLNAEAVEPLSTAPTAPPEPVSYGRDYFYEDHGDPYEEIYTTTLTDLSLLKDGSKAYATREPVSDWSWRSFAGLENPDENFEYDTRALDVSAYDLSVVEDMSSISFSSETVFGKVPEGFNPEEILESNKDPGLGVRDLHKQGVTGQGVGIAVIDQALLLEHEEYADRLMLYERIHCGDYQATMHGPAVASIAAGETAGVAPGAKLYYIASTFGHMTEDGYLFDASIIADCVYRVLEINSVLPAEEKIRVISISRGYGMYDTGAEELNTAIAGAEKQNIMVLTTSTEVYYGDDFNLFGLERDYMTDPNDINSFRTAWWVAEDFYSNPDNAFIKSSVSFPIGSRTYAASTGSAEYETGRRGGLSWAVPWCAGLYALCCQVKPEITSSEFIDLIYATADTNEFEHNGKLYNLPGIVSPAKVIEALK